MPKGIPAPGPWDFPGDNANLENERQNERLKNENESGLFVQCERELKNESRTRA